MQWHSCIYCLLGLKCLNNVCACLWFTVGFAVLLLYLTWHSIKAFKHVCKITFMPIIGAQVNVTASKLKSFFSLIIICSEKRSGLIHSRAITCRFGGRVFFSCFFFVGFNSAHISSQGQYKPLMWSCCFLLSGWDTHCIDAVELLGRVDHDEGQELPVKTSVRKKLPGLLGFNANCADPLSLNVLLSPWYLSGPWNHIRAERKWQRA